MEIMLVLVVIGMASVGVMMTMPQQANKVADVDWQAQRFSTLLQFAEDEALISGKELALVFTENSYRFSFYDYATKKWLALPESQIGDIFEIPESIEFSYTLLGSVWDEIETQDEESFIDKSYLVETEGDDEVESFTPQVFIMSSGEVTPFAVLFTEASGSNKRSSTLEVSMSGAITHIKPGEQ
ncbi:type II secretion system protein GspH [Psychromonas marina]|uniref:Type II secretion system protein GspH n=1 Tax=Psychromonas marina TaxID=88364 RepID=A0ABQ6DZU4_9GAMM|nr:type II secretion system protein GspH [Psychromonas marina]